MTVSALEGGIINTLEDGFAATPIVGQVNVTER